MIHHNDKTLKDMNITNFKEFGIHGLVEVIERLEDRVSLLEGQVAGLSAQPKRGRPPKVVNG